MRIHHYHFGKEGGLERFFTHLANALARRGVEQRAIIRPGRSWRKDIENVVTITESNFRNISLDRYLLPLKAKRLAEREKPDALMAWGTRGSELLPAYPGCIKISRLGDYPKRLSYFRNTDVIVCLTPAMADHVRGLGWTRRIEVIANFTNTQAVAPIARSAVNTPEGVPLVMAMGRFVKRKGFHTLIEALATLPDVWLWLAGEGEEGEALQVLVRERGMTERVRFLGWQTDTRPYVAAADVFAMPSSHEPLGNVIFEVWAQKRPIVATRAEGPSWCIRDRESGLLVDIGDADGLAGAISLVLSDEKLAASLVEGASRTLVERFSEEAITNTYIELFKQKP